MGVGRFSFPNNEPVGNGEVYGTLKGHISPRKNQQITKSFDPELGNIVEVFKGLIHNWSSKKKIRTLRFFSLGFTNNIFIQQM
jgi:hypothetical protein